MDKYSQSDDTQTSFVIVSDIKQGNPAVCASRTALGNPSNNEGNKKKSDAESILFTSGRLPNKKTLSSKFNSRIFLCIFSLSLPSPTNNSVAFSCSLKTSLNTSSKKKWFFCSR